MKKRVSPLNKTASLHRKIIADSSSPNVKMSKQSAKCLN